LFLTIEQDILKTFMFSLENFNIIKKIVLPDMLVSTLHAFLLLISSLLPQQKMSILAKLCR